jgi:hypothetical protein
MAKGNPLLIEPEHDPNDALLQCTMYLKEDKFRFNIKLPGFEGSVNKSRQNEPDVSRMIIEALRGKFGPRVDKA